MDSQINICEFNYVLVSRRCEAIKETLFSKQEEYAKSLNQFHNFDVAARLLGCTPEKALEGMMIKHLVCVQDMINNPDSATSELIDEKIGDIINYLILLEGLLRRRLETKKG